MEAVATGALAAGSARPSLDISVPTPPWLRGGVTLVCLAQNELFFPDDYGLGNKGQIEEARALCLRCPVRDLCLTWALPIASLDGIWGATTPPERRRIRTGRAPDPRGNR